ncbi:thymidine phosphorylase [Marinitoga sp. 1135]|uniref:Pyrimidine-nucleoside phosphorylase n=1 Tax=Marinitoga piezophila (strain DSM 14283 / JCM 11233 / KA3) TaxID=443254 RepID=H2J5R2_MARPK|nr:MULTISPECIES: pyrimidine-nucleoside phosphorylase [Marinitoga]AEX85048.1 pyrimidine-nucleoside phosphorylase [Marinitoga piezophila KA3]APT75556.1 thymidine phosphorylase [Marinitoga sp. 1137]NUU95267.1 thymidine phosphorylase [Marinitoga sp. 1135]NUU97201.1 thymidine phosphorylase [Marinitoga sp. 1138]
MRPVDIIHKKRNGGINTKEEIEFMVNGYVDGSIPDYQISAWLMAIYFNGMNKEERYYLTMTMRNSGDIIDLSGIEGIKIDKHSTGGVGDKTTLAVGPLVASAGLKVSKLSGRGLGHTGGTIDKLESIPGFKTAISKDEFFKIANEVGMVVAGQTGNIAPADKKLYALRDVTDTVDEISLISASIMSKKLAVNSDGIVLDVKTGSGAFMKNLDDAVALAKSMVEIAELNNRKIVAVVTNMDQPLGEMVGNSLEVWEAIETLKGNGPEDFTELCLELAASMIDLAGIYEYKEARKILEENIKNGKALEIMRKWIKAQGGDERVVDNPEEILPISKNIVEFKAEKSGYVSHIDAEKVGIASMVLGAGRKKKEDEIDYSVGIKVMKKLGAKVEKGDTIALLYVSDKSNVEESLELMKEAYEITDNPPTEHKMKLIYEKISGGK